MEFLIKKTWKQPRASFDNSPRENYSSEALARTFKDERISLLKSRSRRETSSDVYHVELNRRRETSVSDAVYVLQSVDLT